MGFHKNRKAESELIDPGFGVKSENTSQRLLRQDGTFNVRREGLRFQRMLDLYNTLITMPWKKFAFGVFWFYFLVNTIFGTLYFLAGENHLNGVIANDNWHRFLEDWFFSAQTLTTVGYGRINPVGIFSSSVAAIESLMGLLGFALATGLLYGRFSKPTAKILFSHNLLVAPYRGGTALMFRLANMRSNQLLEVEAAWTLMMNEKDINGVKTRKFYTLEMERKSITVLPLNWTVVHPIDEKSPIYGYSLKDLDEGDAEFIIMLKAFDDAFSSQIHTRQSYKPLEIIWGAKFLPMFDEHAEGGAVLKLQKINSYENVSLPEVAVNLDAMMKAEN